MLFLMCCLSVARSAIAADVWLNPGPYSSGEGMDTWFGSVYNTTAQHDYRLRVGGWGDEYDTLVRFNLSGAPQVATQAVVWLYAINEGTPTPVYWYIPTTQWQSGTVGWNNQPQQLYLGWTNSPTPGNWYGVIFTDQYNNWRSGNTSVANYGLKLKPVNTNNSYSSFYSSTQGGGYGPWLQITYTPQGDDSVLKLKWPLATSYANRVVTSSFGDDWNNTYCGGLIKKHTGTDFQASAGTAIYAAEDGVVRNADYISPWAYRIVLEHNHPQGGKYTTVYWHVTPSVSVGNFVPKGMQIATVANLGSATHFHFGVRISGYDSAVSGVGSLPQTSCDGYPAFATTFVDPNNTNNVIFQ